MGGVECNSGTIFPFLTSLSKIHSQKTERHLFYSNHLREEFNYFKTMDKSKSVTKLICMLAIAFSQVLPNDYIYIYIYLLYRFACPSCSRTYSLQSDTVKKKTTQDDR